MNGPYSSVAYSKVMNGPYSSVAYSNKDVFLIHATIWRKDGRGS
jgi:hypothetical protein